jgi:hypothetical protein
MAERLTVAQEVAGSKPVGHPISKRNAAHHHLVSGVFTAKLPPKCLLAFVGCRLVSLFLLRLLIAILSLPKQRIQFGRCHPLGNRQDMAVDVHGRTHLGMAEDVHHHARMLTLHNQEGGTAMPEIMEAGGRRELGALQGTLEAAQEAVSSSEEIRPEVQGFETRLV